MKMFSLTERTIRMELKVLLTTVALRDQGDGEKEDEGDLHYGLQMI